MALTTLVGTKWRFDKPATFSSVTSSTSEVYEIVGTLSTEKGGLTATSSLGTIYRYFRTSRPSGVTSSYIAWVNFTSSGGGTTSYSFTMAMESNAHPYPSINGQNRFSTYGYVTLEIAGGSDATNANLITWLQTNATRVTETKLVNATELDENLTDIANAIRTKGGTSSPLAFPSDFVSAVNAIPTGGGGGDVNYDLKKLYLNIEFENWNLEAGEIGFQIILNTKNNEVDPPVLYSKTYTEADASETVTQEIDLTNLIPNDANFVRIIVKGTSKTGAAYGSWMGMFLPADFTNLSYNSTYYPLWRSETIDPSTTYGCGSSSISLSSTCVLSITASIED